LKRDKEIGVIGARSMVASRFCEQSKSRLAKADLNGEISIDITDPKSVTKFFEGYQFESVILFSAFTDVDGAEKQRDDRNSLCWQINVIGVRNIIEACRKFKRKLVFISTDFVFDGTFGPYDERDSVGPSLNKVSWYGITKIEAEKIVQELDNSIIIRISYPYRGIFHKKDDIAKRILRLYRKGKLYPMFDDQYITPTFIDDLAPAVEMLVNKNQSGIFHIASPIITTQYDFARKLLETFGQDSEKLERKSVIKFLKENNHTPRPIRGGLKVEKIKKLGFTPTDWQTGLKIIFNQSNGQLI